MDYAYEFITKPISETWAGLIRRAKEAKQDFNDRGAQVEQFYSGAPGFMWGSDYRDKFMGGGSTFRAPKFRITFNKAFEYVSVMGPLLFWRMAYRKVKPYQAMQFNPAVLSNGAPELDQFMQLVLDKQMSTDARNQLRAQVQERVLNHLPSIQPPNGLIAEASLGVTDALLRGAGFLITEPYAFPGSEKTMVGSFNIRCDDVLVDADTRSPLWSDAGWIGIRHATRVDATERMFNLRPGSLRKYAGLMSSNGQSGRDPRTSSRTEKRQDSTYNVVEWYEVFSKGGLGNGFIGKNKIDPELEDMIGDYAYLCVAPKCPWPLNLNARDIESDDVDDEWIKAALKWPTEYWRDNRWPISKLSFYDHSNSSPWPEPPLAPAIGEMTVANILISVYVQGAYDNSQQLIGVFEGACKELQSILNPNNSPQVIELNAGVNKSINDVLQFINRPEINGDVPRTIEFLFGLIEQRTGMSQMLYGEGGSTNSRSAAEYQGRQQTVNIRPEYMRKCVGEWMAETASKELFAVYSHMDTDDVADMLGPFGTLAWQELVVNEDPEVVLRSSECYVEASDIGRPNHERDAEMLASMQQYLLPILRGYMAQSGNPEPFNGFLKASGKASNMDVESFMIPPPEQNGQQDAAMQQQAQMSQMELQKLQMEIAKVEAEIRRTEAQGQAAIMQAQVAQGDAQSKMMADAEQSRAKLELSALQLQKAQQDAALKAALAAQKQSLAQQAAEHEAMIRERQAATQAATTEHAAGLKQREADAKLMNTQAMASTKIGAADAASKIQQATAVTGAMATAASAQQSLEAKQAEARIKLMQQLLAGQQKLQQAEDSHQQTTFHLDEKAQADAQRSNMITSNKLLMQAVAADQQRRTQARDK